MNPAAASACTWLSVTSCIVFIRTYTRTAAPTHCSVSFLFSPSFRCHDNICMNIHIYMHTTYNSLCRAIMCLNKRWKLNRDDRCGPFSDALTSDATANLNCTGHVLKYSFDYFFACTAWSGDTNRSSHNFPGEKNPHAPLFEVRLPDFVHPFRAFRLTWGRVGLGKDVEVAFTPSTRPDSNHRWSNQGDYAQFSSGLHRLFCRSRFVPPGQGLASRRSGGLFVPKPVFMCRAQKMGHLLMTLARTPKISANFAWTCTMITHASFFRLELASTHPLYSPYLDRQRS